MKIYSECESVRLLHAQALDYEREKPEESIVLMRTIVYPRYKLSHCVENSHTNQYPYFSHSTYYNYYLNSPPFIQWTQLPGSFLS